MTTDTLTMPEPLDPSRLHSPTEVRMHATKVAAYRDALREEEAALRRKQEQAAAAADRVLSEDEYFALALKFNEAQKAKEAQREAERKAKDDEEAAYLASHPATAEIMERSEYRLLTALEHWIKRGYSVTPDSVQAFGMGLFHVTLAAPAPTKGGAK